MPRRLLVAVSVVFALLMLPTAVAQTNDPVLDQWTPDPDTVILGTISGASGVTIAQTFTAGVTGGLSRVTVLAAPFDTGDMWFEIRTTDAGLPTGDQTAGSGTVLASTLLGSVSDDTDVNVGLDVTFDPPAPVVAGQVYAFVMHAPGPGIDFRIGGADLYPGGDFMMCPCWDTQLLGISIDLLFKTYVIPDDVTPPTGTITINAGSAFTNTTDVTLALTCEDDESGCDTMAFALDGGTYSGPEPFATPRVITLPTGDGLKTVSVRFTDAVGNQSEPITDSITLDTSAPVFMQFGNMVVTPTSMDGAPVDVVPFASDNFTATEDLVIACVDQDNRPFISGDTLPIGITTITCTATDLATNVGSTTFTVTVLDLNGLFDVLQEDIASLSLNRIFKPMLQWQVRIAERLSDAGRPHLACRQLRVTDFSVQFLSYVRLLHPKEVATIHADTQDIRNLLGCS